MNADLKVPAVTDVAVAVAPRSGGAADDLWDVYLINLRDEPMTNVLITSQGHGSLGGVDKTTTVLRHFHDSLAPGSYVKIEPIQTELFGITNEYWVSFNAGEDMLDKRYVFRAGQIDPAQLTTVPVLNRPGVFLQ